MPVYATGINPDQPEIFAAERQAEGHTAFKLKIGFGTGLDLATLPPCGRPSARRLS